ncbi:MAG: ABC transporter substrate-binding protein [Streptosporangiales bacterium]|nr:ABC transporter substrate-binding protein [Streptosporangiales bacterium]
MGLPRGSRRTRLLTGLLLAAPLVAAACGGGAAGGDGAAAEGGLTTVSTGTVSGSSSDAALFVAMEKGYFEEQGIKVELQPFDSGARMVAPLGAGQLDVASGGISAGLFNAVADGVKLRIVADKAREVPPGFVSLVVRKELVDSGKYRDFSDLRGLTVAIPAQGVAPEPQLQGLLRAGGLTMADVRTEEIGFANQIAALANGSIDAAISIEPSTTSAVESGAAVRVARTCDLLSGYQTSGILYSDTFAEDKDLATKYMTAYLKGVRYYNDALSDGKLEGPKGDEVAQTLVKHTQVDDPELYKKIALHGVDPNGESDLPAIRGMLTFFSGRGVLDSDVDVNSVMNEAFDSTFLDAATKKLGPYQGPDDYKAECPTKASSGSGNG